MSETGPNDAQRIREAVRELARHADLPLAAGREDAIAPVLQSWLLDANALSRKMSAPVYWSLAPATILIHPTAEDGEP